MFEQYDPTKAAEITNELMRVQQRQLNHYRNAVKPENSGTDYSDPYNFPSVTNSEPETYSEYLYNLRNKDPNAYRKNRLEVASERARRTLAGNAIKAEQDRIYLLNQGVPSEQVNAQLAQEAKLDSLSPEERLQNFIALRAGDPNAIYDRKFLEDFGRNDIQKIESDYGKEAADYAYQENAARWKAIGDEMLAQQTDKDFLSWDTVGNMGTAIARKGVDVVNNIGKGLDLAFNGQEAVERIAAGNGALDKLSRSLEEEMSYAIDTANQAEQSENALRDIKEFEASREYMKKGMFEADAKRQANTDRQWEQVLDVFNNTQKLSSQAAEIGADLVGSATIGGAAAKVAGKVAGKASANYLAKKGTKQLQEGFKQATNETVKKTAASQAAFNSAQQTAKQYAGKSSNSGIANTVQNQAQKATSPTLQAKATGNVVANAYREAKISAQTVKATNAKAAADFADKVGKGAAFGAIVTHGSNQEAIEAVGSTYNQMMSIEPDKLYQTPKGRAIINSMMEEKGFESFEEAKKDREFMNKLYEKHSDLAKEASIKAYKDVFRDSALVNILTAKADMSLAGVTAKSTNS